MRQQIILSCQSNNPVFCVNAQMQEQRFYRLVWSKVSYRGIYGGCIAEFLCAQIAMLEGIVEYGGGNPEFRPQILRPNLIVLFRRTLFPLQIPGEQFQGYLFLSLFFYEHILKRHGL